MATIELPSKPEAITSPRASATTRFGRTLRRLPLHVLVILICLVWMTPTAGLLISSFRPPFLVATTGWWEAITPPFDFTLANYERVLDTNNLGRSFVNSLFLTIPAT
ncbi:MAG: hypothetical protein ACRDJE_14700, partial [Dehalococcoidia bacterium]